MRVVVNERFLRRRAWWSRGATFGGLAALLIGFVISLFVESLATVVDPSITIASTWILMVGGVTAFNTGRFWDVRWVARPREDEVLVHHLSQPRKRADGTTFYVGLDNGSYLLNYLPQMPQVMHLLVGPSGIFPLHVRRQEGELSNEGGKWRRKLGFRLALASLFEGSFGNPTADAQREAATVRKALASQFDEKELAALPIQPLIVFMHPKVKLTLSQPEVPVLTQRDLWPHFRKLRREQRLSDEQLRRVLAALGV
ncbi:MAG: nuclease-related domain-containing protein [Chloroflexota bacterium]